MTTQPTSRIRRTRAVTAITALGLVVLALVWSSAAATGSGRVPGAVVHYDFTAGAGVTVFDRAAGAPLDLTITDPAAASWTSEGLTTTGTAIVSPGAATKLIDAVTASGEVTVEAWLTPANVTQGGPARIVSVAPNPFARNLMLGQGAWGNRPDDTYASRFRTTTASSGTPTLFTPAATANPALTHVVMTRTADGTQTIYVDGLAQATSQLGGTAANWDPTYPLALANTADGARPWTGTLCMVAIYDTALDATQVDTNFAAGCARAPNNPPALDPLPPQGHDEGASVSLAVTASDPDGDPLTYAATNLPAGLTIDPATGSITGVITQTAAAASPYTVQLSVDDQRGGTDATTLDWTVTAINVDPVLDPIGDQLTAEGQPVDLTATATDPDNDPLTFQLSGAPAGWSIDPNTGQISGLATTAGTFPVTVTVGDGQGGSDLELLNWTVAANNEPAIDPIADQTSTEGDSVLVTAQASDLDGDPLTYAATGLPAGLGINATSGQITGVIATGAADASPHTVQVTASDGLATASTTFSWTVDPRQGPAPVVRYDFSAGSGATVIDRAGGTPLNLTIGNPAAATWTAEGLAVTGTTIVSAGPATKLIDAVIATNEISVELWIIPANATQGGPARIVAVAPDSRVRNLMLGQGAWGALPDDTFASRFRTSSSASGTPTLFTAAGTAGAALTHVVMTRAADGTQTIYVDGVAQATSQLSGTTATWDASYPLSLANTPDGRRPWSGTLCRVAIYDLALDPTEVSANHAAGCGTPPPPPNTPPVVTPLPDQTAEVGTPVSLQVVATDDDGDPLSYAATGLPDGLSINPTTGLISGTPTLEQIATPLITVDDGTDSDTTAFTWTVGDPPPAGNAAPRLLSGTLIWDKLVVGTNVDQTHQAVGADFDGDGDTDVAATDYINDLVLWYENDGADNFTRRVLDPNLDGAYPANVGDLDRDGDVDILAAGYDADAVVWYENNGGGSFTRHVVDSAAIGAHSVVLADLDDDGDTDLVTSNQDAGTVTWYENDGAQNFVRHTIDANAPDAKRADVADVDGDGNLDVIAISFAADELAWHRNDGSEGFTKTVIDTNVDGGYFVSPADLDGDGDPDLLTASQLDNTIAWFENDGAGNFTKRPIDTTAQAARTVIATDIDRDGDLDAVAASVDDDTISWYENDGAGNFQARVLDLSVNGAYGLFALDFEGDGDTDILSAGRNDDTVSLHRQSRLHDASVARGGTLEVDAAQLAAVDAESGPAALTYTLVSAPSFGELQLNAVTLPVGATFTQADVDQGLVTYAHAGTSPNADQLVLHLSDGEPGRTPITITFNITIDDPAALLVHLPLDDASGTTATDASGNGNTGTLTGGATFEANTPDGSPAAVRLDGVSGAIALPAIDVDGAGLTLALWFNPDSFATHDARLISKASGTSANAHVFMLSTIKTGSDIRLRARIRTNGTTRTLIATGGNLVTGTWQHAALTYDGSVARLYLDGVEVGAFNVTGSVEANPAVPVAVGAQPPGAGAARFDGLIDDVRILQQALTAAEIAALAQPAL